MWSRREKIRGRPNAGERRFTLPVATISPQRLSSTFFDQEGRPSFNALQNYGSAPAPVVYYVFDVMVLAGQNVMREPLERRRELPREEGATETAGARAVFGSARCRAPGADPVRAHGSKVWWRSGVAAFTSQGSERAHG